MLPGTSCHPDFTGTSRSRAGRRRSRPALRSGRSSDISISLQTLISEEEGPTHGESSATTDDAVRERPYIRKARMGPGLSEGGAMTGLPRPQRAEPAPGNGITRFLPHIKARTGRSTPTVAEAGLCGARNPAAPLGTGVQRGSQDRLSLRQPLPARQPCDAALPPGRGHHEPAVLDILHDLGVHRRRVEERALSAVAVVGCGRRWSHHVLVGQQLQRPEPHGLALNGAVGHRPQRQPGAKRLHARGHGLLLNGRARVGSGRRSLPFERAVPCVRQRRPEAPFRRLRRPSPTEQYSSMGTPTRCTCIM